jgi:protein-tyrosine phosphatase
VERTAPDRLSLQWHGDDPVSVYVATRPDASPAASRRLVKGDRQGRYSFTRTDPRRPYFILKDEHDGSLSRVAERLLPLEGGSNFRDLGGYPAADGRHVRWGMIFRTGATPMLTDADFRYVSRLGLGSDIDLRSTEERQIAPDQVPARTGARYLANDYSGAALFSRPPRSSTATSGAAPPTDPYRDWLISLAPQYREIFGQLLGGAGAVAYHCSAGQDRTGVATALVLSALGVPREVVMADYHLSTLDRRPENEMPRIDPARYPGNVVAAYYARAQAAGSPTRPRPLYDPSGAALLDHTFNEIETRWGSVDNYLREELGVDGKAIARLRAKYLD